MARPNVPEVPVYETPRTIAWKRLRSGMAASGRGCVKTQNRSLEVVSKLGEFSVEVSCLLTGRYRLVSRSIASHVVYEGDFWGETVVEF